MPTRLLIAALPLFACLPALAAEEAPAKRDGFLGSELNPVTVTGSRSEQEDLRAPFALDVVDAREMRETGAANASDALQYTPGVSIQKTGRAMGSPYIRGFTGYLNVLMVDGVRLNNSLFRSGPNQYWGTVDGQGLERIEVAKGAASVLYGSDAIGGAVNAITTAPRKGEHGNAGGRLFLRGASAEQGAASRLEAYGQWDGFGFAAGGTVDTYGDLRAGGGVGEQGNTGYHDHAEDVKLNFALGEKASLTLFHQRFTLIDSPRTHATTAGKPWNGTSAGTDRVRDFDQVRELTYAQLSASDPDGPVREAKASLSWQEATENQLRVNGAGTSRDQDDARVGTLGSFAQATLNAGSLGDLTVGCDLYRDNVNTAAYRNGAAREVQGDLGADEASYLLAGLFVQDRMKLGERLEAVGGVRFNYVQAKAGRVADVTTVSTTDFLTVDESWTALNGSLKLLYTLSPDELVAFGGWSQGFRAPNLSDLTSLNIFGSGNRQTPNLALSPEHYDNFELGMKGSHETVAWAATGFYTRITDGISAYNTGVPNPAAGGTIFNKVNAADGFMTGVELEASVKITPDFTAFGNATWLYGRQDTFVANGTVPFNDYPGRLMPPKVNLGARFQPVGASWYVTGILTYAGDADLVNANDDTDTQRIPPGGTPGYVIGSLGAGWSVAKNVDIAFTLENVTNEDYRVHGSGSNAAGMNAVASVNWRF